MKKKTFIFPAPNVTIKSLEVWKACGVDKVINAYEK